MVSNGSKQQPVVRVLFCFCYCYYYHFIMQSNPEIYTLPVLKQKEKTINQLRSQ